MTETGTRGVLCLVEWYMGAHGFFFYHELMSTFFKLVDGF